MSSEENKSKILEIFKENVIGKKYEASESDKASGHNGKHGHWLEKQMNIKHNSKNEPDILGYEMKVNTSSKTSLGDWSPDINGNSIKYKNNGDKKANKKWWNSDENKTRFMKRYGSYNKEKKRWSWAIPTKFTSYNKFGQKFAIDIDGIFVIYNKLYDVSYDSRDEESRCTMEGDIKLMGWSHDEMRKKVNSKFAVNGYFRPITDKKGIYIGLQFGKPITYEEFLKNVKNDNIYLDSGTKVGNPRPYMQWRASNKWFDKRDENNLQDRYIMLETQEKKMEGKKCEGEKSIKKSNKKTTRKNEEPNKNKNINIGKITVVDLFCGCGGITQGLNDAGFEVLAGIDIWDKAIETYQANQDHTALCRDLTKFGPEDFITETEIKSFDLLVGGPPCQGFSIAGKRDNKDPRNSLFMEYVKYLNYFKPKAFIMENVVGILSMKTASGELVRDIILSELRQNYECEYYKLSAADFEVPQKRVRILFIGFRKDLGIKPTKPESMNANNHIAVKTILEDKEDIDKKYYLSSKALEGIRKKKEKMEEKGHGFGAQYLDMNEPSYTIPARYWKDGYDALVKYSDTEVRRLTIKELARIQTFPEDYEFKGSKKDIIMQIGNAVACKFAYHIGKYIQSKLVLNTPMIEKIPKKLIKENIKIEKIPKKIFKEIKQNQTKAKESIDIKKIKTKTKKNIEI